MAFDGIIFIYYFFNNKDNDNVNNDDSVILMTMELLDCSFQTDNLLPIRLFVYQRDQNNIRANIYSGCPHDIVFSLREQTKTKPRYLITL